MQKIITVTIDTKMLQQSADGPFTINEVEGLNALLAQGWAIENQEFLSGEEDEKAVLLVTLNDEFSEPEEDFDYGFRNELEDEDDEDALEDDSAEMDDEGEMDDEENTNDAEAARVMMNSTR